MEGTLLYSLYGSNEGNPLKSVENMLLELYKVLPKTAILRYDSPKDFLGTDEDNSENQEFLSSGTCIHSEFNFLRRMMINFEG